MGIWKEQNLYRLYEKAYTPWEWHAKLAKVASDLGLDLFSSPFDETAVDFLEEQNAPVHKIASFEVVDIPLVKKIARTGKPIIISNGMTTYSELSEAINAIRGEGNSQIIMLHCNSGYPALHAEANLATMPVMGSLFNSVYGLSDHTLWQGEMGKSATAPHITPLEAVKLGASVVEVHLMLDRNEAISKMEKGEGGFDWAFSREPDELKYMVDCIRSYEKDKSFEYQTIEEKTLAKQVIGKVSFEPTSKELESKKARPSLWVVKDIKAGDVIAFKYLDGVDNPRANIDTIRPAGGLECKFAEFVNGKKAKMDIKAGTPLMWEHIDIT